MSKSTFVIAWAVDNVYYVTRFVSNTSQDMTNIINIRSRKCLVWK